MNNVKWTVPDGWTKVADHRNWTSPDTGKSYTNMIEFSSPCRVCGQPYSIFVSHRYANRPSSFSTTTCKEHRGMKRGPKPGARAAANTAMQEKLDALEYEVTDLREAFARVHAENQKLKAELAEHKPPHITELFPGLTKFPE